MKHLQELSLRVSGFIATFAGSMRIDIITVLPEMIEGFINESILARAQKKGLAEIHLDRKSVV